MVNLTQAQLDGLYKVYLKWQNITPECNIMPEMFLGIESDGYTHS